VESPLRREAHGGFGERPGETGQRQRWNRAPGRLSEVTGVLAAQAPDLKQALERARADGLPHLILDGKVVETGRCREKTISTKGTVIDLWYSGKTHDFGGNIQALFAPDGLPLWVSDVLPGNVHDITAARELVLGVLTPVKQPADGSELDISTRTRNALLRSLRSLGERGFALLCERWTTLQHVTMSPSRIGDIAKAALVLVHFEHRMIT
jgi:hypothetical protein